MNIQNRLVIKDKNQVIEIKKTPISYQQTTMFMHCKKCLTAFLARGAKNIMSPSDAMDYEIGMVPFKYPGGIDAEIVVVWCKRCKSKVWDSRHLTHLF